MIIWGSRTRNTTTEQSIFHCPQEQGDRPYEKKTAKRWFTLYFIPVFPMNEIGDFVECQTCGSQFYTHVLDRPTLHNDLHNEPAAPAPLSPAAQPTVLARTPLPAIAATPTPATPTPPVPAFPPQPPAAAQLASPAPAESAIPEQSTKKAPLVIGLVAVIVLLLGGTAAALTLTSSRDDGGDAQQQLADLQAQLDELEAARTPTTDAPVVPTTAAPADISSSTSQAGITDVTRAIDGITFLEVDLDLYRDETIEHVRLSGESACREYMVDPDTFPLVVEAAWDIVTDLDPSADTYYGGIEGWTLFHEQLIDVYCPETTDT